MPSTNRTSADFLVMNTLSRVCELGGDIYLLYVLEWTAPLKLPSEFGPDIVVTLTGEAP